MAADEPYRGFEQGPIRPPSERDSLLVRVTRNCPWNRCTFCGLYKGERFSRRPVTHVLQDIDAVRRAVDRLSGASPPAASPTVDEGEWLAEHGVPYISVLTHPTTGGVSASLALLGDLNIAEPKALIGFAGPRVIEQTVREKLPEGFQRSEFLLEHGAIDMIVDRRELRDRLASLLAILVGRSAAVA